jgi:hypothetical protein
VLKIVYHGSMQQFESEWTALKELVQRSADGITEAKWCMNDGPDCLQLDYVAATFRDGYRVLFDRRPKGGSTSLFAGDSPVSAEEWQLEPKVTGSSVMWSPRFVPKLHGDFSSNQLAEKIVARLVQYHEAYTKACIPT